MTESMEIFFFIRKDENRPNDVRVILDSDSNLYKVQWHHDPSNSWADEFNGTYSERNDAIAHALTKTQTQIEGFVRWTIYDEQDVWLGEFHQRMTHEVFDEVRQALGEDYEEFVPLNLNEELVHEERAEHCNFRLDDDFLLSLAGEFRSYFDMLSSKTSGDNDDADEVISEISRFLDRTYPIYS